MPTYVILDRDNTVCDTAASHTEALRVVDYLSRHEHKAGPYRCVLVENQPVSS